MCDDLAKLETIIKRATVGVPKEYFLLPVAGSDSKYRERVYCYELYHQMKSVWCDSFGSSPYSLCGEVDKRSHQIIKNNKCPDFLIHEAGNMDNNFAIVEVKSSTQRLIQNSNDEIINDLMKLTDFLRNYAYHYGIYLFYGNENGSFENIIEKIMCIGDFCKSVDLSRIAIYHHQNFSESAVQIDTPRLRRVPPE